MTLVRAKHSETGHLAALPADALALGMCPGWVEVDGPAPSTGKAAVLRRKPEEEPEDAGEQPPPEIADATSAKQDRS